jgi:hypothetical protein
MNIKAIILIALPFIQIIMEYFFTYLYKKVTNQNK